MQKHSEVVKSYEKYIYNYFHRNVENIDDVDDLVQDVIIIILKDYIKFKNKSQIKTWIYGICKNKLYEYYRASKKRSILFKEITSNEIPKSDEDFDYTYYYELVREILSEYEFIIFQKFYLDKLKIKVISQDLKRPEGTIKFYLFKIREKLQKSCFWNEK